MNKNLKSAWLIWSIPASFFSLVFVIRILPSFVMQNMMTFYDVNYAQFSLLPSCYYAGYALMQIPTGLLLTKFRNSTVIPILMLIVAIGTFIISESSMFTLACLASLIIGIGSTVGVLGSSSIIKSKFSEQAYGFVIGLTLAFGLVAASYAGRIINIGLTYFNWRQLYAVASVIVLTYAIVTFLITKEPKKNDQMSSVESNESVISLLKQVLHNRTLVILTIFSGLLTTPMQGFADVWGVGFLSTKFNLTTTEAVFSNSFIFLGMGLGSPFIGILAQKYQKLFLGIILCAIIMFLGFVLLLLPINLNQMIISIILLFIGIGSAFPTLTFTLIIESVDTKISRVAISFANMVLMLSGSLFHPIIGGTYDIAIRNLIDTTHAYTVAISLIPIGLFIGILGLLYCVKYRTKNLVI